MMGANAARAERASLGTNSPGALHKALHDLSTAVGIALLD